MTSAPVSRPDRIVSGVLFAVVLVGGLSVGSAVTARYLSAPTGCVTAIETWKQLAATWESNSNQFEKIARRNLATAEKNQRTAEEAIALARQAIDELNRIKKTSTGRSL